MIDKSLENKNERDVEVQRAALQSWFEQQLTSSNNKIDRLRPTLTTSRRSI